MIVPELRRPLRHKQENVDDKRIRLCFETEDLHQDCPGIHEKYSIIIKLLSVQLEENYYQF